MIDDSIVRGTTCARIIKILREAGAKEVHMRVTAPPFLNPCYYGTDIDSRENLIAVKNTVEEIAKLTDADSLGYLRLDRLPLLLGDENSCEYCNACFSGEYPTKIPEKTEKYRFEKRLSERQ